MKKAKIIVQSGGKYTKTKKLEIFFKKHLIFLNYYDIITTTVRMPIWRDRKYQNSPLQAPA